MTTFQERLLFSFNREAQHRKSEGEKPLLKTDIWKAAGKTSGAATNWFDGSNGMALDVCFLVAPLLKVNPFWLFDESQGIDDSYTSNQTNSPQPVLTGIEAPPDLARQNFSFGPDIRGTVPLISWVRAGNFSEAIDNMQPGEALEWIETTVPIRSHTFALRVEGDSMEPDFPEGTLLIVEPDMEALPGDFVIAKNGDDATFKQLTRDGGELFLKPKNERYPIRPLGNSTIVGVVRAAERKFR
jgi:SOS-response transcriptional repressor LexA